MNKGLTLSNGYSSFRLSPETKGLLRGLGVIFDTNLTAVVTRLIREESERRGLITPEGKTIDTTTTR